MKIRYILPLFALCGSMLTFQSCVDEEGAGTPSPLNTLVVESNEYTFSRGESAEPVILRWVAIPGADYNVKLTNEENDTEETIAITPVVADAQRDVLSVEIASEQLKAYMEKASLESGVPHDITMTLSAVSPDTSEAVSTKKITIHVLRDYSGSYGDYSDLMYLSEGDTHSLKTPMGTTHENDRTASEKQIEWLADPTQQPDGIGDLGWAYFGVRTLYPFGDPVPADVNQHAIGDCSALAVLGSIAHSYPGFIRSIIEENENTFTVTLYDPMGEPVKVGVDNYFIGDGTYVNAVSGKNNEVTWATVLEKALMKWKQVYNGSSDVGGISSEYTAPIFLGCGEGYWFSSGRLTPEQLEKVVNGALQQGNICVGGFDDGDLPVDNMYKTVNFHAYSMLNTADASTMFTMRNPWGLLPLMSGGYSDGKEDGLLPIKANDGKIPGQVGFRIMEPGPAAKAHCAQPGELKPYTPPVYRVSPMRITRAVLGLPE